jgi:hypothetical protein
MRQLVWSAFMALAVGQAAYAQSSPVPKEGGHWNQEGGQWNQEGSRSSAGLLVATAVRRAILVDLEAAKEKSKNNSEQAIKACATKLASDIGLLLSSHPELTASDIPKNVDSGIRFEALSDDERACFDAAIKALKTTLTVIQDRLIKGEGER